VREPDVGAATERLAGASSRRGFLGRVGEALMVAAGVRTVGALVAPTEAEAFHFCGHIYTTDSCPHPTGLPRIDRQGLPLRAKDGHPVDDLGRLINDQGQPIGDDGRPLTDPDGRPLPIATRTPVCQAVGQRYGFHTQIDGSWHRCCGGHVRKLMDCCAYHKLRINGDAALTGYCFKGRKVFCVTYFQTRIPC
jgi:hypothetical protein